MVSIRFKVIEKPGVQEKGGRHETKRSCDPRVAYPEVKVQVRDLVRVVGIIDPLPHGESVFGGNSIYRAPGCKWAQEQRYDTGDPSKF